MNNEIDLNPIKIAQQIIDKGNNIIDKGANHIDQRFGTNINNPPNAPNGLNPNENQGYTIPIYTKKWEF